MKFDKKQIFTARNILLAVFCLFCVYSIVDVFIWQKNKTKDDLQTKTTPVSKSNSWTDAEKKSLTDTCFLKSSLAIKYPEIIQLNCSCVTEEIVKKYTPQECAEMGKLPLAERSKILKDIILHCGKTSGRDTIKYP